MTLLDSSAIARAVLDGTSDAVWLAYPSGVVRFVNDPFGKQFGWSVATLNEAGGIGALFAESEDAAAAFDAIARGERWEGNASLVTVAGQRQMVTHRLRPIDDRGEFCAIAGYVTDVGR